MSTEQAEAAPRFRIVSAIETLNGEAVGSMAVLWADRDESVARASGNWLSQVTRSRLCKTVAAKAHPPPKKRKGERSTAFARRVAEADAARDAVAEELEALLLRELDRCEKEAEAAEATKDAEPTGTVAGGNGKNGGSGGSGEGGCQYVETEHGGLARRKGTPDGPTVEVLLANFTARVTAEVVRDDGAEQEQAFTIESKLRDRRFTFTIPARQFSAMNWPTEYMGAGAIVFAGQGARDHARVAVQMLSTPARKVLYTHTGWQQRGDGSWVYLHAGGAIGAAGPVRDIEVDLAGTLGNFRLPDPPEGEAQAAAVRASLKVLRVTPGRPDIAFPVYTSIWRAVIGGCDFSLHLAGRTGVFKSAMAALAQQHYGAEMDGLHLPASWKSTDNALEGQCFLAKDALLVVDEFCPGGTANDVQRWHQKVDRIVRGVANHAGRDRMKADGSLRPNRPPRCVVLSTGEDVPKGESLRARMNVSELGEGDVGRAELSACQTDAAAGLYAQAMAGFVRWVAGRYERLRAALKSRTVELRAHASRSGVHARTPDLVANLAVGLEVFLDFAKEVGAVTKAEAETLWREGWEALSATAERQTKQQEAADTTRRFIDLLAAAVSSGQAHLAGRDGREPENAEAWGWRAKPAGSALIPREEWQPQGPTVGWVDGDCVYLDPEAAYAAVQRLGGAEPITIACSTVGRRLSERGLLIREGERDELKVRRTLAGAIHRVWYLRPGTLMSVEPAQPAQPPEGAAGATKNGDFVPDYMAGFEAGR
jgi:hypothetical protein